MNKIKILKCPACGSSEIEQQSNHLAKCSHCGSNLLVEGDHLVKKPVGKKETSALKYSLLFSSAALLIVIILFQIKDKQVVNKPITQKPINQVESIVKEVKPKVIENPVSTIESDPIVEAPVIEVISQVQAETVIGGMYWVIQLKNTGSTDAVRTRAIISLFDENDKRIEEQSGWSIPEVLKPGETTEVLVLIAKPPKDIARTELTASASKPSFLTSKEVTIEVTDYLVKKSNNRFQIIGDVINNNTVGVKFTNVVAVAYNDEQIPVGIAHQYATKKQLGPNESSGFKINSTTFIAQQPKAWKLWAIARKN